ncbi:MAG: DUF2752 domain-containing protein, partial [Thermoanaerobaculia bacterium]
RQFADLPCPGCGITTSVTAILGGDWTRAMNANPAGPFVFAFFLIQLALFVVARQSTALLPRMLCIAAWNDRMLFVSLLLAWFVRIA